MKVDVRGLDAGQTYYYRFRTRDDSSPIGRTRTAPAAAVDARALRRGLVLQPRPRLLPRLPRAGGRADLDAVIHLGDYIYEYGPRPVRERPRHPSRRTRCSRLADYRTRHAQYKRDPDLQEVHRQHPFIVVWDDHEFANNASKRRRGEPPARTEGAWADRKAAALRAYAEWMPIREQAGRPDLAHALVGRSGRPHHARYPHLGAHGGSEALVGPPPPPDPARTLLGDDQAAWLEEQIAASDGALEARRAAGAWSRT